MKVCADWGVLRALLITPCSQVLFHENIVRYIGTQR